MLCGSRKYPIKEPFVELMKVRLRAAHEAPPRTVARARLLPCCASWRRLPINTPVSLHPQGSLNTFLNAFTYPDRTCYPVASCNLQARPPRTLAIHAPSPGNKTTST